VPTSPFHIPDADRPAFTAGRVVSFAVGTLIEMPRPFFLLHALQCLLAFGSSVVVASLATIDPARGAVHLPTWAWSVVAAAAIVLLVPLGAMIHAAIAHLRGEPVRVSGSLAVGVRRALPLTGVVLALTVLLALGLAALVVPFFLVACALVMALPAVIAEPGGAVAALRSAVALGKGHRWTLLGAGVAHAAVTIAVGAVTLIPMLLVSVIAELFHGPVANFVTMAAQLALAFPMAALTPLLLASAYVCLREARGEPNPADVFA
jgi:hypothetical protein